MTVKKTAKNSSRTFWHWSLKRTTQALLKPTNEEEISKIIWSMDPDKAPGPDGFTIHFYRICWDIIKPDLIRMIKGFLQKAKLGGSTNSTFLALIRKKQISSPLIGSGQSLYAMPLTR
jgi:hypothetical protein